MKYLIILALLTGCADKLQQINNKVNQNPYIPGKYDCRKFAEDKYHELIKEGYKDNDIQFVITDVKEQPHVVLLVDGWILDNNFKNPYHPTKKLQNGLFYKDWPYKESL